MKVFTKCFSHCLISNEMTLHLNSLVGKQFSCPCPRVRNSGSTSLKKPVCLRSFLSHVHGHGCKTLYLLASLYCNSLRSALRQSICNCVRLGPRCTRWPCSRWPLTGRVPCVTRERTRSRWRGPPGATSASSSLTGSSPRLPPRPSSTSSRTGPSLTG